MKIGRHELLLIVGIAIALAVAVFGQMTGAFAAAAEFEGAERRGLLPGLALMAAILLVYVQSKRRGLETQAAAMADQARRSEANARQLKRLVAFWEALTQALDLDAIRDVARHHLPEISGSRDGWVVTRPAGEWTSVLGPTTVQTRRGETKVTDLAVKALARPEILTAPDGVDLEGQICFPMIAGGENIGILGVPAAAPSLTDTSRQVVGAAAALLGVSLRGASLLQTVRENSLRDTLTGCMTRGHALDVLTAELKRARRSRHAVSLILLDLDQFKSINDRYGHLCGDAVLAAVGARIRATLRFSDLKCRYGGEEFLVLLPETSIEGAQHVAESLRRDISELEIQWEGQAIRVTSSLGVAIAHPNELDPTPLIARADEALYRAKRDGRNCVRVSQSTPAEQADSR
jgi:diguanylate cyclase (GGDEF)-like protein